MNDITEELITILKGLYERNKQIAEIADVLDDFGGSGLGFLHSNIIELEFAIVKYLGGNKDNYSSFGELDYDDPFFKLENGNITSEEFLKQIKKGIELNLTPQAVLKGEYSFDSIK